MVLFNAFYLLDFFIKIKQIGCLAQIYMII